MTTQLKRRTRDIGIAILAAAVSVILARPVAAADEAFTMTRVRSANPFLAALIRQGAERSITFRRLIQTIDATDGLVYVEEGKCGHGVRACLINAITLAGPHRVLQVLVDTRRADWDLVGSIGHELRHAVEVLSTPGMRSWSAMFFFYQNHLSNGNGSFETQAAIDTGVAIRAEFGH